MNRRILGFALIAAASLWTAGCGGNNGVTTGSGGGSNPNPSSTFAFYLNGVDFSDNFYGVAGSVAIDTTSGTVKGGEEDYNDAAGVTAADQTITGGTLTVNSATGQGTLTLITGNGNLGANGTETLGVQFVNAKHALLIQFDGSATSSGSMDLQTLPGTPAAPSGNFAFALSGVDPNDEPVALGGVFSASGNSVSSGTYDLNDASVGEVVAAQTFTGTISTPDSFGRGKITQTNLAGITGIVVAYYIVGPECIRLIDMDSDDSAVGSAFGQGSAAFTNASVGSSVFELQGNSGGFLYDTVGAFTTSNSNNVTPADFTGIADDNEEGSSVSGATIGGTYTIGSSPNGYGRLTLTTPVQDVANLGVYMTDRNLNLNDPNNTTSGLGGAVIIDLDASIPAGSGVLIPQTDTSAGSFAGDYGFGGQEFNNFLESELAEVDFVGQGTVSGGALSGAGLLSDPFKSLGTTVTDSGVTFSGTATPDSAHVGAGHYTMPLVLGGTVDIEAGIYQASGHQLFWIENDDTGVFGGPMEQQATTVTPLLSARAITR